MREAFTEVDDFKETVSFMELRDLLHHHGVPTQKTEERANLAIKKIGEGAIEKALHSRNP